MEGGHIHWTRDHKGGCKKRGVGGYGVLVEVTLGEVRRGRGRVERIQARRRRVGLSQPARGSGATYSQPAPAVRGGRGALSLSLDASDFPNILCLLLLYWTW